MTPGKLDLPTIWRGCDWGPVTLKWKDQNGDPIPLTGWAARAYSLNVNLNARITNYALGYTELALDRNQTAALKLGTERWDWIFERVAGQYRFPPFLSGRIIVRDPVTTIPPEIPPSPNGEGITEPPEFEVPTPLLPTPV